MTPEQKAEPRVGLTPEQLQRRGERRINSKKLHKGIDLPIRILRFLFMAPGGEMRLSALKQQMRATRYPGWQAAYDLLVSKKAVEERLDTVNNQTVIMVRLLEVPNEKEWLDAWIPMRQVEKKKRKKRRQQTEWFKQHVLGEGVEDDSANRSFSEKVYDNVQATREVSPFVPKSVDTPLGSEPMPPVESPTPTANAGKGHPERHSDVAPTPSPMPTAAIRTTQPRPPEPLGENLTPMQLLVELQRYDPATLARMGELAKRRQMESRPRCSHEPGPPDGTCTGQCSRR